MLIHTCDAVPMPFPCLACRGLGICALAFRGIAECIVQLGTRSTTVLMLTYNFTPQEASKYSLGGLQAPARACVCVCVFVSVCGCGCLLLLNGGPSDVDGYTMQAVQPSRLLVWSYVSVICACGCRVAHSCRECCKPVLNVTRATVQLIRTMYDLCTDHIEKALSVAK